MKLPHVLIAFALTLALSTGASRAQRVTPEYAQQNLDRIPATDPPATDAPQLLAAVAGQHPRLLYSQADIDALKARIAADPILKKTYDDNLALVKRMKAPVENPPAIVLDDTASLSTAMERYAALAYFYSMDHDPAVKKTIVDILTVMLNQPYWADTAELDSNMGAANNMLMVSVLFDAVYNDLDPDFRAKIAANILVHARRLYYLGFKQLSLIPNKYWQQDPQPNHRWYRLAGELSSLLVINGEPGLKSDYLLQEMKKEMDFVMKWYPPDGDCHEGAGYQDFGFTSILRAAQMMDRDLGTTYVKDTGLRNAWAQQIYYAAPAGGSQMSFGDDMNSPGAFGQLDAAFFACPAISRNADQQAMLKRFFLSKCSYPGQPTRPYIYPWDLLEFYDPSVGDGDYKAIPTNRLFPDLGAASLRDSWDPTATAFTFKCGPYGGYKLNEYRQANRNPDGSPHYVNVAHDDPDANSFSLTMGSDFMFHPGLYSLHKITENQSSITVDGKGQINEGTDFMQPVEGVDMRTLAYLTGWKQGDNGRTIIEGEAARSYIGLDEEGLLRWQAGDKTPPGTPRPPDAPKLHADPKVLPPPPVLKRFRRTAIWMPGDYVLLLDDIRGNGTHDIMWRGTVENGQFDDPAQGRCHAYTKAGGRLDFQILANKDFNGAFDYEFLDGRFGSLLARQFQFSLKTDAVKFACLFDPWKKKPTMTLSEKDDVVTLKIHSDTFDDTWTWQGAKNDTTPSPITGTRAGAPLMALTESDKAPTQ
jgi:hypothetical protein